MPRRQPRIRVYTRAGGRTTHRLYSEGLYSARVVRDRTSGRRMILDVVACPNGEFGKARMLACAPDKRDLERVHARLRPGECTRISAWQPLEAS